MKVAQLTIVDGNINASSSNGAGIGAGLGFQPYTNNPSDRRNSSAGELVILGGNIRATGSNGTAIGTGPGSSVVLRTTILGGSFILKSSSSGIGSGSESHTSPSDVNISGGFFDCRAVPSGLCFNGTSVTVGNGSVAVITSHSKVWSSKWKISGEPELYFEYASTSEAEALPAIALLHLQLIVLPYSTIYALTIRQNTNSDSTIVRKIFFDSSRSQGCAFSIQSLGNYRLFKY